MHTEPSYNRTYTAFINRRSPVHNRGKIIVGPGVQNDIKLLIERYRGIRDHGRKKQSMGTSAHRAPHPADADAYGRSAGFYGAVVVTMDGKTAGVLAGAGKSVKRKALDRTIIKFLRNSIAIINRYSYHKHVPGVSGVCL